MNFNFFFTIKTQRHQENRKEPYCFTVVRFSWCLCVLVGISTFDCAEAAFLDFSVPAREAALGGNGVAVPEGTSSLAFNPAGLGSLSLFEVSARYENLFPGIEGDSLSTGNLSAVFPLSTGDALGFSIDHFGANNLEQDRLLAAFGKSFGVESFLNHLRLGMSLSYLNQQFTLQAPLSGVNPANVSAGAFSVGVGMLYDPVEWASLGFSIEDLNQPNLGVVGADTVPILYRYGVAIRPSVGRDRLVLTLDQTLSGDSWETQGGTEWNFSQLGVALRAGGDANMGVVGFGWRTQGLTIDYAYQFSWNQAPSINGVGLPGSHLLEVGFFWENTPKEEMVFNELAAKGERALKAKQWKDAFWDFQQANLLKPSEPLVLQGRSEALKQYNLQRALDYYQAGIKAESQGYFPEAQRNYEWAAYLAPNEKSYSDSRDRMKKSLTQGALEDPRVRELLEKAMALLKRGENGAAVRKIQAGLVLYPNDAFLQFVAKAFARKTVSRGMPEDKKMERWAAEAEIFRSKGRLDLARKTWREMLKKDPDNAMAQENLAENNAGQPARVLSETQLQQVQALLQEGLKAYANGDTEGAVKKWESVLRIDSRNVNALNNLTRVKIEEGENKK